MSYKIFNSTNSNGIFVIPLNNQTTGLTGVLLAEFAVPHGCTIYRVPNDVEPVTAVNSDQADSYVIKSFSSESNNGEAVNGYDTYVIVNQVFKTQILNTSKSSTVLSTFNGANVTTLFDTDFSSYQYVAKAPSGTNTEVVMPTPALIPFLTINGKPLMSLTDYFNQISSLLPSDYAKNVIIPGGYSDTKAPVSNIISSKEWAHLQAIYSNGITNMVQLAKGELNPTDVDDTIIPRIESYINDLIEKYVASVELTSTNDPSYIAMSYPSNFQLSVKSTTNPVTMKTQFFTVSTGELIPSNQVNLGTCNNMPGNKPDVVNSPYIYQLVQNGWNVGDWKVNIPSDNSNASDFSPLFWIINNSDVTTSPVSYHWSGSKALPDSALTTSGSNNTFYLSANPNVFFNVQNTLGPLVSEVGQQGYTWDSGSSWLNVWMSGVNYTFNLSSHNSYSVGPTIESQQRFQIATFPYDQMLQTATSDSGFYYPVIITTGGYNNVIEWDDSAQWPVVPYATQTKETNYSWTVPSLSDGWVAGQGCGYIDYFGSLYTNSTSSSKPNTDYPLFVVPGPFTYFNITNSATICLGTVDGTLSAGRVYYAVNGLQLLGSIYTQFDINYSDTATGLTAAEITLPTDNIQIMKLKSRKQPSEIKDEIEKLAEGYYGCADLMVSGYYNQLLQKVYYQVYQTNQTGPATLIQQILGISIKFNYLSELLTEWINNHPFDHLPPVTHKLMFAINEPLDPSQQYTEADVQNAVNTFFSTTIPGSVDAYHLSDSPSSTEIKSISNSVDPSLKDVVLSMISPQSLDLATATDLLPNAFRVIIKKVMAQGAMLEVFDSYARMLKLHQISLKSSGSVDSNGNPILPAISESPSEKDYQILLHSSNLDQARYNINTHKTSSLHPLIYPMFDEVMNDIKDDIEAIRYLTEDRLHGLSYNLYRPEIHALIMRRTKLTHAFIHMFSTTLHTMEEFTSKIFSLESTMDRDLLKPIDTLIFQPLTHIAVGVVKFAASALLDMTACVAPGSELLDLLDDINLKRPLPFPKSPFPVKNDPLFKGVVINGSTTSPEATFIQSLECIVPFIGLAPRSSANNAYVYTNGKSYSLLITPNSVQGNFSKINSNEYPQETNSGGRYLLINDVKPGLHYINLMTSAGVVKMWYSATMYYTQDSFQSNGYTIPDVKDTTYLGNNGFFCFVPDPCVSLDERIDLPKTFHKWILSAVALPGIFWAGAQSKTYTEAVKVLDSIPGFENFTSHISTTDYMAAMAADGIAATTGVVTGVMREVSEYEGTYSGSASGLVEPFVVSSESIGNMALITTVYNRSKSLNVLNSYTNQQYQSQIQLVIATAWNPNDESAVYSLNGWNLFNHEVIDIPDMSLPAWFPESTGRLFGDALMGIAKIGAYLFAQHHVFKKWDKRNDPDQKNKTKLRTVLWNHLMKVHNDNKLNNDFKSDLSHENHSFLDDPDKSGLREFENDNSKSIRQLLGDSTNVLDLLKDLSNSLGEVRGLN